MTLRFFPLPLVFTLLLVGLLSLNVAIGQAPIIDLVVEKLPPPINSDEYDEISPVVSRDGQRLYFTRTGSPDFNRNLVYNGRDAVDSLSTSGYEQLLRRVYTQIGGRPNGEVWRSRFNQDIWLAEFDYNDQFVRISHPDTPLNNALPNALGAVMPEPGHFITINQFPKRGGLGKGFSHTRRKVGGGFTRPEPIIIDEYATSGEGVGVTLSDDGEIMILSLERSGGFGKTDLYVSRRMDSLRWSKPVNLGDGVNTSFRESTPSLSEDKKTLYFSSNRWGRGGNDIYFCRRVDTSWHNWSLARRFKPPISSERDDSQPYFNEATGYLYLTSNRDGSSDIYRVRIQEPKPLDILVVGRVKHARTGELMDARVDINSQGIVGEDTTIATVKGRFEFRVKSLRDFTLSAEKDGFIGHVERLNIRSQTHKNSYEVDILLDPQEKGGTITLDPIFFQQSLSEIKKQSLPQLERLRDVLNKYPNIYVRIEGHTDGNGKPAALDKLSRERAQAILAYLLRNGIDPVRVQARGLGAKKPIASDETKQGRETNRRVEVIITRIMPAIVAKEG
ncbi:MAG: OmpA family protein [Saprospiraceae bacterium]